MNALLCHLKLFSWNGPEIFSRGRWNWITALRCWGHLNQLHSDQSSLKKKKKKSSKEFTALVLACSLRVMNETRRHLLVSLWSLRCFPQTIKISLLELMIHQGHTTLKSYLPWLKNGGGDHVVSEVWVILPPSLVLLLPSLWNDVKHPG